MLIRKPNKWLTNNKPDIRNFMTGGAVKKTAWKGKHKIQDRWESDEYQDIEQPTPGIPVYKVKCIAGGRTRVLHCNLLLPLQGRLRQSGDRWG